MNLDGIEAVIVDVGGTLVVPAPAGTPVADLEVELLPNVLRDLRTLAGTVALAAATNTAVMTADDVRALLAPSGVSALLDVVVTSHDVGADKPDPTVLRVALERLGGVDPRRAVFVGDDPVDAAAAAAIGMPFAPVHPDGLLAAIGGARRRWARPIPRVGDSTSAAERAAHPQGWRMDEAARDGLRRVVLARRDVRRFRPDAVADHLLRRVLEAAHAAPSVGHSQPWRFVVVTDPDVRDRAALVADRERLAQAAELAPDAAAHLLDLQLEGIREAPMGIVVGCDRRTPAAGVLGRRTMADADLWSCACAIQNLWLTARAEGLGVGWVTLFPPDELAGLVGFPPDVVPLGWLCLGWPDERLEVPGLERAGWSTRLGLDEVVFQDRWPDPTGVGPLPPPSRLRAPDPARVVGARDDADAVLAPVGALGVLDRAVDRVLALGRRDLVDGTVVIAVGRHPVADLGVSPYVATVTEDVVHALRTGEALGAVAGATAGLRVEIVDAGTSVGNLRDADALGADQVARLVSEGRALGRRAGSRGLVALGEVGIGNTTVAAALAAALLGREPEEVVGLGAGADAAMLQRKRGVVAAALDRTRGRQDALDLLGAVGGPDLAVLAGVVRGAAEVGAPVLLDGLATSVAALVSVRSHPGIAAHLIAGQRSRELAHAAVLVELGLEPLLDLRLRAGEGVGAALASRLLLDALAIRRAAARTV